LIRRLQEQIDNGERTGTYREYPVIDKNDHIYWPGKFPDLESIKTEELRIGDKFAWANEFLLTPLGDKEPIIEEGWIQRYIEIPQELRNQSIAYASGVDLAVSEKRTADYTAIVGAKIVGTGEDMKIYLLPNPLNAKTRLPVTIDNICTIASSHDNKHTFYVEEVGTQLGLTQLLKERDIKAIGVAVGRNDKRTRLALISDWIRSGKILFPHKGTEDLERQILNFGL
jgi:phage terminase large subunit-like protein